MTQQPRLLLRSRLVRPLRAANRLVNRITADLQPSTPPSLLQGAFVMAVSAIEVGLADSLSYYLRHFPEKIPRDLVRGSLVAFPDDVIDILERSSLRYTVKLSYESFPRFFDRYQKILSIDLASDIAELISTVQEVKASRNLLLHNGLKINEFYLEQAGKKRRASSTGGRVEIDDRYVTNSVSALSDFADIVAVTVSDKYAGYTKISAHHNLWSYLFDSPVMPYKEYWKVDEEADKVVAMKKGQYEGELSSTELLFLGFWRAHFNGNGEYLANFDMRRFDRENARKIHFLMSIAREFPWS